jgi:hypothetical protein
MDEDDIRRSRSFGWNKHSDKIDADSFFVYTKNYCINTVGEAFFYDHFRVIYHSFKDDPNSEVFTIKYLFYPPGLGEEDFIEIIFKRLDFLNIHQMSHPENLPPCLTEPEACLFPIDREAATAIAREQILKERDWNIRIERLNQQLQWDCQVIHPNSWAGERFTIDTRTGEVSMPKAWQRID